MKYNTILFDLDGTLTDPGLGITNSVMHALKKRGIDIPDRSELYKFIGPPLIDSFMNFYGMDREEAVEAVKDYREYYSVTGIFENLVYDGIEELLHELKEAGYKIALATSKPEHFAKQILDHYNLSTYFDFVGGALMDESRTKKHEVIEYVLENMKISDTDKVLMIGDREHDVLGAKTMGIDCLGVLFGYGDLEELTNAGAKYIAKDVTDLKLLLLSTNAFDIQ